VSNQEQSNTPISEPKEHSKKSVKSTFGGTKLVPTRITNSSNYFLAISALLVALISISCTGILFWWITNNQISQEIMPVEQKDFSAQIKQLLEQNQQINIDFIAQNNRINELNNILERENLSEQRRLLAIVQEDTQALNRKLERTLSANRDNWHLAEAESLVRLAIVRANAMQDASGALILLKTADDILREQDDPSSFAVREQLAHAMEQLKISTQIDRTGIFLKIAALHDLIAHLDIAPQFANIPTGKNYAGLWEELSENYNNFQYWQKKFGNYVRIDFVNSKNNKKVFADNNLITNKLALSLSLRQTQWAVLNANQEIYQQSLAQVKQIVDDNFSDDNQIVMSFNSSLQELINKKIMFVIPNLNPVLSAMQNYLNFKNNLNSEQKNTNIESENQLQNSANLEDKAEQQL